MKPQETTMINDERNIIVFRSLLVISAALCAMCSRADFFSGKGEFHEVDFSANGPTILVGISQPFVRPCPFGCLIH